MSDVQNSIEINAIKEDLKKKITFPEMSNTQRRQVIDVLFPEGVAFWYADPKAALGDKVFGWGDPNINEGGFFFAEITTALSGAISQANLTFKFQS